jgi:hypothetical protein
LHVQNQNILSLPSANCLEKEGRPTVEEGELTQPVTDDLGVDTGFCSKDLIVEPEANLRSKSIKLLSAQEIGG